MNFWDTSALVPLLLEEKTTPQLLSLLEKDPQMLVWTLSSVECYSALFRRHHANPLTIDFISEFRVNMDDMEKDWLEVTQVERVRRRAERLLGAHKLRAADAIQLAAALVGFHDDPKKGAFVSLDLSLSRAALLEGFQVLP